MKRFISLLLTLAMVCSLVVTVPVWAETAEESIALDEITNISLHVGADPGQRNLTWFSTSAEPGMIVWAKAEDLVDGAIPADAESAVATRDTEEYTHKAGYHNNKVVITNLEPETKYYYQLSNGNSVSEMYSFTTGADSSTFSFAFIGDSQIGAGQGGITNGELGWARTVNQIATATEFSGIDFLISAGDQVNSAEGQTDREAKEEQQYDVYLNQPAIPGLTQAVVLGNHDDKMTGAHVQHYYQPNMDTNYGATYNGGKLNSANYYFVYNSALFVVLNTNDFQYPQNNQPYTDEMKAANKAAADKHGEYIEKVLEETKDNKDILWKIIMYHQSPYGGSYHGNDTINDTTGYYERGEQNAYNAMREYLMPYIYDNGFDLVLSGHDHCYTRTKIIKPIVGTTESEVTSDGGSKVTDPDGVLHITGATSSGSQVNNVEYPHAYAAKTAVATNRHAARFDITPNTLSLVVYNLGNDVLDNITTVDTFTIEKTADVILQNVTVEETATIPVGQTKALNAKLSPAEPTSVTVEWESDDEDVATVDENGNVTAIAPGTANITVTATDNNDSSKVYTATCTVNVIAAVAVESIAISPAPYEMLIGDVKTLTATVSPDTATTKAVVWDSDNKEVATVSSNGSVTAIKAGTTTITATATDGSGIVGSCTLTVNIIPATKLTINKESISMNVMDTDTLSVTVEPENASYKTVTWKSSAPDIVSVDETGAIKALKAGSAVITATTGEGKSVSCTVTSKGGVSFFQNYEDANDTRITQSPEGSWSRVQDEVGNWVLQCDGSKITAISQSATALDSGEYSSTLAPAGFTVAFDFYRDATDAGYSGFQIRSYNADGVYSGVTFRTQNLEKETWYNIKMVWGSWSGAWIIYCKKTTETEYTRLTPYNCANVTNKTYYNRFYLSPYSYTSPKETLEVAKNTSIKIDNVKVAIPVAVTGLTLSAESGSLNVGKNETIQLTHTLSPSDATDTNVCYTSSNPAIASVDQKGLVTAKGVGDAVITATSADGLFTDTYAVNVYSTVTAESVVVPESLEMTVGDAKQISANVLPAGAPSAVAWSSSDESIATVDENGNITAIKHGNVTITATAVDGSGIKGECDVTVNYIPSVRILSKTSLEMDVLDTEKLAVTFEPANASYQEVTWSSSNTAVATVDADGTVKAMGDGTATIFATTLEGSVECAVTVKGGVTYLNDFEDPANNSFTDGNLWTKVQEDDGNWVLDFSGTNLTASANHLNGANSGNGMVPVPGALGGFVLDFDVKRMSDEGHKTINLRIGSDANQNHYWRVNISKLDLNEWYDVKLLIRTGISETLYWKKASESTWQSTTNWWATYPFLNGQAISNTVNKNSLVFYPYVASSSDDKTLATAQKTHFRMDNIKVSSPVAAIGYGIAEDSINLMEGETAIITNTFTPSYATDTHVTYISSDANVATVDKYGKVTAVGNGTAVITAIAADGGFMDTVAVAVVAVNPEISVVKDGNKFTVTTNVTVDGEKVYIAAYNASNVMLAATVADYMADGTELTLSAEGANYYKAFIWDKDAVPVVSGKVFN